MERPTIASGAQLRQHELGHYGHGPRAVGQQRHLPGHDARSRSKTSYTHWVRFCQSMHSARLDTRYLAESFSRMSDMFNLEMYKRYISLLLEYNSAFFVMLSLFWNLTFLLDQLKLFVEMKVMKRTHRPLNVLLVVRDIHIQPFSIQ